MDKHTQAYIERLEADGIRKVGLLAEIIHCVQMAQRFSTPIDGDRILQLAKEAVPYAPTRQPTNPATLIGMGQLDA
jgi:hypothetical protein